MTNPEAACSCLLTSGCGVMVAGKWFPVTVLGQYPTKDISNAGVMPPAARDLMDLGASQVDHPDALTYQRAADASAART